MSPEDQKTSHGAEAAALGFWYQSFFALLTLAAQTTDDAAIGIEQLDDVELKANGKTLLYQLKHSIKTTPLKISLKSRSVWRTVKVWVDALPLLNLAETTFHLVTVAGIEAGDPLVVLMSKNADRAGLAAAMTDEANRVLKARATAAKAGKRLPHADRVDGCEAFLGLSEIDRINLLRRVMVEPDSPSVSEIENKIASYLHILPAKQRPAVARRLIEWWDRQIVYSLCGERCRIITRAEFQAQISAFVADLDQDRLVPEFETVNHPEEYQPDGMLTRQIAIVNGGPSDLERAIREEWKARAQRARWLDNNPAMRTKINDYDLVLKEYWSDLHSQMVEDCTKLDQSEKCASGLKLLRWTHNDAPKTVRPIAEGWSAAYYVRGSYQVLAINLQVGWHPEYTKLLGEKK